MRSIVFYLLHAVETWAQANGAKGVRLVSGEVNNKKLWKESQSFWYIITV